MPEVLNFYHSWKDTEQNFPLVLIVFLQSVSFIFYKLLSSVISQCASLYNLATHTWITL